MATINEVLADRYMGTAAEFAAFTDTVKPGSTYWVHDTNKLYKTYNGTTWVLYVTLG